MREGEILADDTPDALRDRTGSDTVEAAFLHLVDEAIAAGNQPATGNAADTGSTSGEHPRKETVR
jgi:ABC-2 type transport system ATP-binding protein